MMRVAALTRQEWCIETLDKATRLVGRVAAEMHELGCTHPRHADELDVAVTMLGSALRDMREREAEGAKD